MSASPLSLLSRLAGLLTGQRTSPPPVAQKTAALLDQLNAEFDAKVDALVNGMQNGTININQFVGSFPSLLRQHHLAAAVISSGGAHTASPDTLAIAQQASTEQLAYFDRWSKDLLKQANEGKLPSWDYIRNRAKMYAHAATETASKTQVQAHGVPTLPFYPAQSTLCLSNCRCEWRIETLDVVNANYDCFWELGVSEHCATCIARWQTANPLQVRGGQIVNPERYQADALYGNVGIVRKIARAAKA